ncbi:DUF5677 domain-containing protein [Serratia marcescens]|uniref:DUF5677 domain-containing protein n=1 Tax=Serratia marcescens TaxID=615 RepID=UPI003204C09D
MSKEKIIANAFIDYELYKKDFSDFSQSTLAHLNTIDVFEVYWSTLIFKSWKEGVNHIGFHGLDEIFDELHQDINSSYYLASMGLYRTSNMHLRSMIELSLQSLYFYEHPVELKKWRTGSFIIKHDKLKDYLKDYPNFECQPLKGLVDTLIEQISKEWKTYSKHIHAESLSYFQTVRQPGPIKNFDVANFGIWQAGFTKIVQKINKLFMYFFAEQFKLFPSQNKELLTMK